ncbi:hypothetical protein AB6A40_008544 [Gnathostoma spinigerum]|uniref:Uncharacterized protein n=1 Tax=Gnathostoma spinigerum TaxID=75299 RepID=A0ABD6EQM3_9BILA
MMQRSLHQILILARNELHYFKCFISLRLRHNHKDLQPGGPPGVDFIQVEYIVAPSGFDPRNAFPKDLERGKIRVNIDAVDGVVDESTVPMTTYEGPIVSGPPKPKKDEKATEKSITNITQKDIEIEAEIEREFGKGFEEATGIQCRRPFLVALLLILLGMLIYELGKSDAIADRR